MLDSVVHVANLKVRRTQTVLVYWPTDFPKSSHLYFFRSFDFRNLKIHEALRIFLETFRLPGEAQIIERIMICFSQHWIVSGRDFCYFLVQSYQAFNLLDVSPIT